jgi:hypothetical protein
MPRIMSSIITGQSNTIAHGSSAPRELPANSSPITIPAANPT